ncbi:MAG: PA2778 family cysteine peptidase [Gammaproteobacteria bacterium]|nr:PA2778 family cysteine peptidase [Gammaproteobacteria bacterium]MBU1979463.1 PA2778 family cysteine peptidase [Gammaproteobacteria bacterium]
MLFRVCARLIAGVFFLIWLGGCATPQTQALLKTHPRQLPQQMELSKVPFYPQETHQCGPASLAMALNAGGAKVTPQDLTPQVYLPGLAGSLQVEMLAATRRNGFLAYELAPKLDDLLVEVAAGSPVLVLQNVALSWYPVWHYAVVVGYDLKREEIILRSGLERRQVLPFTTFEHTWERAGYWAMLALPPGRMPRTATEAAYVAAAVAVEKFIPPKSAEAAYDAALKRWPRNLSARIGLGNAAYAQGKWKRAEKAYLQATLDHPKSAIAYNNLAQTLAEQKRYPEALALANQAVLLGGPEQDAAKNTLDQIRKKMRK